MLTLETLLLERKRLLAALSVVEDVISKIDDGFVYHLIVHCYGASNYTKHTNNVQLMDIAQEYYGDNGLTSIFSDNPDIKEITSKLQGNFTMVLPEGVILPEDDWERRQFLGILEDKHCAIIEPDQEGDSYHQEHDED